MHVGVDVCWLVNTRKWSDVWQHMKTTQSIGANFVSISANGLRYIAGIEVGQMWIFLLYV